MRSLKMLGLTMVVGLAAMATVGASPAMATPAGLCETEASKEEPCESVVTHVHEVSVGAASLLTSLLDVECEVLLLGEVTEDPLTVTGAFTYTNCNENCTVEEVSGPSVIEVLKTGHETASVTGGGEVHVKCGTFVNCYYSGEGLQGTATGPLLAEQENGEVSIQGEEVNFVKGFFCPETGELDITTTPLNPTYIAGQMRCVVDPVFGSYLNGQNVYRCSEYVGPTKGSWELTS